MGRLLSELAAGYMRNEPRFRKIEKLNILRENAADGYRRKMDVLKTLRRAENDIPGFSLKNAKIFCPDFVSMDVIEPVISAGAAPIFIDASFEDWGMDSEALERAFEIYPDVRLVLFSHIYGFPGQVDRVAAICREHDATLIEDATEVYGARLCGRAVGSYGDYGIFGSALENENRNIEEMKRIYEYYEERLAPLDIWMNPIGKDAEPNYMTPCMLIEGNGMCSCTISEDEYTYEEAQGRTCPMELLEAFEAFGVSGELVYKPMHLKPMLWNYDFVTVDGSKKTFKALSDKLLPMADESRYIYERGVRLPAYPEMTKKEQDGIIDIIYACFNVRDMERVEDLTFERTVNG